MTFAEAQEAGQLVAADRVVEIAMAAHAELEDGLALMAVAFHLREDGIVHMSETLGLPPSLAATCLNDMRRRIRARLGELGVSES